MAARTTAVLLMITPMVGALSLFLFGMCADFNSNSESHVERLWLDVRGQNFVSHGAAALASTPAESVLPLARSAGGLGANFDFAAAKDMVSVNTGLPTDFGKASRGR